MAAAIKHQQLKISGMTCAACVSRVERVLAKQKGVITATVNLASESAYIEHTVEFNLQTVLNAVEKAGYTVSQDQTATADTEEETHKAVWHVVLAMLVTAVLMLPMVSSWVAPVWLQWLLATPVQFWLGARFFKGALGALRNREANMDVLVVLGTLTSYLFSVYLWLTSTPVAGTAAHLYFEASSAVIAFVLLGKYLEKAARRQTVAAIAGLEKLRPNEALRYLGKPTQLTTEHEQVALESLRVGEFIKVGAGERLPCDGVVLLGQSHVDESSLNGEPLPSAKKTGCTVHAGTLNQEAALAVQITALGANTLLGKVIGLIAKAQGQKLPVQEMVDRVANIFVPAVLGIAAITGLGWFWYSHDVASAIMHMVTVVVVACPCALGLATPAAIIAGTGAAARAGILIREPKALHVARRIDTLIFDKTGTLTAGHPQLREIITIPQLLLETQVLSWCAGLQAQGGHPLAKAVMQAAKEKQARTHVFLSSRLLPGIGVEGEGTIALFGLRHFRLCNTAHAQTLLTGLELRALLLAMERVKTPAGTLSCLLGRTHDAQPWSALGLLVFADELRPEAATTVKRLKARGLHLVLLSGDRQKAVDAVAKTLGLDFAQGQCSPLEKATYIKSLQQEGRVIAMVGDGINDAPAMAYADLAIAMGEGSDIAMQTAHVTLMRSHLQGVVDTLDISSRIHRNIAENLFWAFAYNLICIPLAAFGLFNPMMAGVAMAMSSVSVVTNALRLTRWKSSNISE